MKKDFALALLSVIIMSSIGVVCAQTLVSPQNMLQCRSCSRARFLADCTHLMICDATLEECYMDQILTDQGTIVYEGGCRAKDVCARNLGRKRDRAICSHWGDVTVKIDADGTEFLEMKERQTKTRTGLTNDARQVTPRLWSTGDARDPVSAYRFYAAKRPHGFSNPSDPFYLSTRTTPLSNPNDQWFLSQRMGLKKIAITMKSMAEKAGIERRLTNHSARKHLVQKLRDSKQAPTDIMQISGHKNVQSIINYSSISLESQKECSKILSGCCPAKKHSVSSSFSKKMHVSPNKPNPNLERNSVMQPVVGATSNTPRHQQVPPSLGSVTPSGPSVTPPGPLGLAASAQPGSTPGSLNSMFWGATVHIHNMNFYTMPGTSNQIP